MNPVAQSSRLRVVAASPSPAQTPGETPGEPAGEEARGKDMGDGRRQRQRLRFGNSAGSFGPFGGAQTARIGVHQHPNEMMSKVNFMNPCGKGFEANVLPAKGPTDDAQSCAPAHITTGRDPTLAPAGPIGERGQAGAISPATFAIQACGHTLSQRLVRPHVIVISDPASRAPLLSARIGRRRRGHFRLVNPMHLFMRPVVLRARTPGKLDLNAQPQPPGRQPGQIQRPVAGKGGAVIHPNDSGFSITPKELLKIVANGLVPMPQQPDAQEETAEQIAHRQRVHALAIASAEPAFEVHRPDVVGCLREGQTRSRQLGSAARPGGSSPRRTEPPQPVGNRSHLGQANARMFLPQVSRDLFGAPRSIFASELRDGLDPMRPRLPGRAFGPPRTIAQSWAAESSETAQPFETCFATDALLSAQLRNRLETAQGGLNEALSRLLQRRSFPRHDRGKLQSKYQHRYLCLCSSPSPMSLPRAGQLALRCVRKADRRVCW